MRPLWSISVHDLVVTGTDTGVGKTLIAAALVKALRARGVRAIGFKPAETGIVQGEDSDSEILARASGERVALASPLLRLPEPLAPAVAAERAGVVLNPEDVECRVEELRKSGYTVVIEGAGGVMVPLSWDKRGRVHFSQDSSEKCTRPLFPGYTVLDLAEKCDLDAVVVGRAGLGTLNHIMMTVLMLQSRRISVRGVVLNGRGTPPDLAESTNPDTLARMLPGLRIVEVPHLDSVDAFGRAPAMVDRLL
jgi:dethiobiotin synthetase